MSNAGLEYQKVSLEREILLLNIPSAPLIWREKLLSILDLGTAAQFLKTEKLNAGDRITKCSLEQAILLLNTPSAAINLGGKAENTLVEGYTAAHCLKMEILNAG